MATLQTDDGATIWYETIGTGPRDLLFLHGWGGSGSRHFWDGVIEHLDRAGLRLILADLRGHGKSEKTTTGFTTERFARDMFAVADAALADRLIVVAFSMSGKWAQWMACTEPDRVAGQVLIAPGPAIALPLPEDTADRWIAASRTRETWAQLVGQFTKEPLPATVLDQYFADVSQTPDLTLRATLTMVSTGGFLDALGVIRAATLVIGGAHDPLLSPDVLRQMVVARIPGARLALLDCGHETPLEKPRETAGLIAAFLAGLG